MWFFLCNPYHFTTITVNNEVYRCADINVSIILFFIPCLLAQGSEGPRKQRLDKFYDFSFDSMVKLCKDFKAINKSNLLPYRKIYLPLFYPVVIRSIRKNCLFEISLKKKQALVNVIFKLKKSKYFIKAI